MTGQRGGIQRQRRDLKTILYKHIGVLLSATEYYSVEPRVSYVRKRNKTMKSIGVSPGIRSLQQYVKLSSGIIEYSCISFP